MCDTAVVVDDSPSQRYEFTMADHAFTKWTQRVAAEPAEDVRHWWAGHYWRVRSRRARIYLQAG